MRCGATVVRMDGLYALKPWYTRRLAGVRSWLVGRDVSPTAVSLAGVAFACAAATVVAFAPHQALSALAAGGALVGRLACANLDGGIARAAGRVTARGSVANELSDRVADLVVVVAFLAHAPLWLVAVTAFATTLPSWASLAGAAAGMRRLQGGPVGKTERCLLYVVAVGTGYVVPVLAIVAAGSAATAVVRLVRQWRALR